MKQRTDFYPRPPRGGRPYLFPRHFLYQCISIHALREEGDLLPCSIPFHINLFLSTPSARRATSGAVTIAAVAGFLSTPSARRATRGAAGRGASSPDFYPRPPRGGRLVLLAVRIQIVQFLSTPSARRATWPCGRGVAARPISIHALREEGDYAGLDYDPIIDIISIHALREEGDIVDNANMCVCEDFYPRPPRGGRPRPIRR